ERAKALWERALRSRGDYENEERVRRRDGEYRLMLVRAIPVLEADGSVREWVGAHTDITERKAAEEALRERTERLEFLSDAAGRLLTADDPRAYAEHLFERLSSYLELEVFFHYLAEDAEGSLALRSVRGVAPEAAREMERLAPGEGICGRVAATRTGEVAEEVQASEDPALEPIRE